MFRTLRIFAAAMVLVLLAAAGAVAESFTFVHLSDAHITGSGNFVKNLEAIAGELNAMSPKPAFVVMTGDQTETGLPRDWDRYKQTITAFSMPVYNVVGNHETKWSHVGKFGPKTYLGQSSRYSFDHGGVHFVAMDSSVWLQHHGLIDKSQISWLVGDLEKAGRDTPSVLFYHHCPGFIPNEPELLRALRPFNVRLILVGHGHTFKTWRRDGLLFQEAKGAMNNEGGYRILEVSDTGISSFTKLVGKAAEPDVTIPLQRPVNPVTLIRPRQDETFEGKVHVRAMVRPGERTVEYAIDGDIHPLAVGADGICDAEVEFEGTPGWHTLTVMAKDPDGTEWTDSAVTRINGASREAWRVRVSGGVERGVRVIGDRVFFGALGGDVYCLDARTGKQMWRYSRPARDVQDDRERHAHPGGGVLDDQFDVVSEVAVGGGLACLGTTDGKVVGLDAATGELRWEFATGGPILGTPAIGGGRVMVGSGEPAFYAIDATTGKQLWKTPMERATQVVPLQLNGAVQFGAWDRNFYSLDARTGGERWKTPVGISFYFSTANSDPATDGRRIIVNVTPYKPEDHDIYCLDAASGNVIWSRRNPGKSDCGFNSSCVEGDRFYSVAGNGEVFCMALADGKEIWRGTVGMSITGGKPAVADGKVYVTGLRGSLACLDIASRKAEWTYSTGEGYLFGGETIWQDLVIVPSTAGTVTAVRR